MSAVPDLSRGRCLPGGSTLHPDAWISDDPGRQRLAVAECRACPCLRECGDYHATLPKSRRPSGVVAGKLYRPAADDGDVCKAPGGVPSAGGYTNYGCRCEGCQAAKAACYRKPSPAVTVTAGLAAATGTAPDLQILIACDAGCQPREYLMLWSGDLVRVADDGSVLAPVQSRRGGRDAARRALQEDCCRSDNVIAAEIHARRSTVRAVRAELEQDGSVPVYRPGPGPYPWKGGAARLELLADPQRSNMEIGRACGCSHRCVAKIRLRLEAAGEIPRWRGQGGRPAGPAWYGLVLPVPGSSVSVVTAATACASSVSRVA